VALLTRLTINSTVKMMAALTFNRGQPRTGLIHHVEAVKWGFLHVLFNHVGVWGKDNGLILLRPKPRLLI